MPRWLERSESQRLEALASFTRHIAVEQTTRCTGGYDFWLFLHIHRHAGLEFHGEFVLVNIPDLILKDSGGTFRWKNAAIFPDEIQFYPNSAFRCTLL